MLEGGKARNQTPKFLVSPIDNTVTCDSIYLNIPSEQKSKKQKNEEERGKKKRINCKL